MMQLFTKEALLHVIILGSVPYSEIQVHINATTVCVFHRLSRLYRSHGSKRWRYKSHCSSNIGWATAVIDDGINGFDATKRTRALCQ
jgi:hypothetical protein